MADPKKKKVSLTTEVAQRMYAVQRALPQESKEDVRNLYEAMANEARQTIGEKLDSFAQSVTRICFEKKHLKSTPPTTEGGTGTPCPQCRQQVRYMRTAIKVVMPNSND